MSRHKFLGSTDLCNVSSLLNNYNVPTKIPNCVKIHKIRQQHDLALLELGTLLTSDECDEIIRNTTEDEFEPMSDKYDVRIRNGSRLVVIDDRFARTLWRRLKFSNKLPQLIQNTRPLGFNVQGEWEMSGVNPAMRLNKYKKDQFFAPHKDAQYAPSGDERSLLSLIIYLNDDFTDGETKFYFPKFKPKSDIKGLTVKEEIEVYGGLENGYECVTLEPKKGYAVLFTHNLLHEAMPWNTKNSTDRLVLRTDVLVKRKEKPLGFAVSPEESDDYFACLNFFRQAQRRELEVKKEQSPEQFLSIGELYERSLSIRYCYPRLLERKLNEYMSIEDEQKSFINRLPSELWLHILKLLHEHEVQNLMFAYPEFQSFKIAWDAQEKRSFQNDPSKHKFIPLIDSQYGSQTLFRFTDIEFFNQYTIQCCRVAAVYAFFLLGHAWDSRTYTVRYNRHTHEVCEVEVEKLLADVFYNRNCYGCLYRVKQKDEQKREAEVDLDYSVDRSYMTNRHESQFIGQDLLSRFHFSMTSIKCNVLDDEFSESEVLGYERMNAAFDEKRQLLDVNSENYEGALTECNEDNRRSFHEELIKSHNRHVGTSVCRMLCGEDHVIQDVCLCYIGSRYDAGVVEDLIDIYNHLVFDFDTHELTVERLEEDCVAQFSLLDRPVKVLKHCLQKDNPISYYRVNIEELAKETNGFNHASCHCLFPDIDVNQFSFLDYTYLSHVDLAVIENGSDVFVLAKYDGIAAF